MLNKKVMIIGGSGSLGMSLIKRLANDNELFILSRDESKHWALKNKFKDMNLKLQVCDIRDKDRLSKTICRVNPNIVIIAAALKHVDVCELSPEESIATNLQGVSNVVSSVEENLAALTDLETVLMVSTDKACSPINVYGMCKSISERIVLEKSRHIENVKFVATRYGNVLETRGSIVPLFMHQAKNNEFITVTREDMTRFVMTLEDSVDLIINCIKTSNTGETYIPKLKSMKIIDLAKIFAQKYNMSAGCDPWPMKNSKISLDGKFVSEGDDDLEPYFMVNTDDGVGYIYPYAFGALPKKSGGHHVVRMD